MDEMQLLQEVRECAEGKLGQERMVRLNKPSRMRR